MSKQLAVHLVDYRKKSKKTQPEMATLLGMSYSAYQKLEANGVVKKVDYMEAIKNKTGWGGHVKNEAQKYEPPKKTDTLESIAESFREFSHAFKDQSETNKIWANNYKDLLVIAKVNLGLPTEQTIQDSQMERIINVIALVASGKKYPTRAAAVNAINNLISVPSNETQKDSGSGVRKKSKS